MSKIFDELERLESTSRQISAVRPAAVAGTSPAAQPAATNLVTVKPPPMKRDEPVHGSKLAEFPAPAFLETPEPAKRKPLQAMAFDASMILLSLAVFSGICVALGSANVLELVRQSPWLALVPLSLVALYFLLPKILGRGTPGAVLAGGGKPVRQPALRVPHRKGLKTLGTLTAPSSGGLQPAATMRRPQLEDLALAAKILSAEGVLDVAGSLSVRDDKNANRIYIAAKEIKEYDLNGTLLTGDTSQAHADRFLHCEIYRSRPDVMAIVYSQAPELIPFAASSVPMLPILELADFLIGGVPVFESRRVGPVSDPVMRSRAIAHAIAESLGDKAAVLLRGRGAVAVGPSLHTTVGRAYYMNMNARLQAQTILLGGSVNYLDPSDTPAATTEFERAWEYWKQKSAL